MGRGDGAGVGFSDAVERAWARLGFFLKPPVDNAASLLGDTEIEVFRGRSTVGSGGAREWPRDGASAMLGTHAGEGEREGAGGFGLSTFFLVGLATTSSPRVGLALLRLGAGSSVDSSFALLELLGGFFVDAFLAIVGLGIVGDFDLVAS